MLNSTVRVYWTKERRWFRGTIDGEREEDGDRIHHVTYDDGDTKWHHLVATRVENEAWMFVAPPAAGPKARAKPKAREPAKAPRKRPRALPPPPNPEEVVARSPARAAAALPPAPPAPPSPPDSPLPRTVEWLPCGVTKLSGFLTQRQQQRLFDTAMIAGWDHRKADHAADSWYTGAADAPDILLHYNYYSEPRRDQPPPLGILLTAARVAREFLAEHGERFGAETRVAGEAIGSSFAWPTEEPEEEATAAPAPTRRAEAKEAAKAKEATAVEVAAAGAAAKPEEVAAAEDGDGGSGAAAAPAATPTADFASVLGIGYRSTDSFRWHTDMAGDDGWVLSISLGATATFEYLPRVADSARLRAQALAEDEAISVPLECGDCLLFHGGFLPHRVAGCASELPPAFSRWSAGTGLARLNLQVRLYGHSEEHALSSLLRQGYGADGDRH